MKPNSSILRFILLASGRALGQRPALYPGEVVKETSWSEMSNHLSSFTQYSEEKRDGNRALGTHGFALSVKHAITGIRRCQAKFVTHITQDFPILFEKTESIWLTGPDGERVEAASLTYNTGTFGRQAVGDVVKLRIDDKRGTGCRADQWRRKEVENRMVLVKGGVCELGDKVMLAKENGAVGVILHDVPEQPALHSRNAGLLVPAAVISDEDAQAWTERLDKDERLRIRLNINMTHEERIVTNVIAETTTGSPDDVVMLGARLDSWRGVGINDNASGCAALIELLETLHVYKGHTRRIRFAFWAGNIGSEYYVAQLNDTEAANIRVYMDIRSIATRDPNWAVFSYNREDWFAARFLHNYLEDKGGVNVTLVEPGSDSDSAPFHRRGIPCTGLTAGADDCKGLVCDVQTNIDLKTLDLAARAAVFSTAKLVTPLLKKTEMVEDLPKNETSNYVWARK